MIVDLRSDTVTKPTKPMLDAMMTAEVGDDVFGDDPTVIRLQEKVAKLTGKEAAVYVPSGTMSNQIALHCATEPGDEVYCDEGAHILNFEAGAAPMLSGIQLYPIIGKRGIFTAEQVEERLRPRNEHFAPSRVVEIENTHNRAGGVVWKPEQVEPIRKLCDSSGLHLHLDGARIWNASAATGKNILEWTKLADSVSVCFSKGLGCPVGSALAGSKDFITKARKARKRFGGGMRQAGILAAAAIYALDNHRERLGEDHRRAKELGNALQKAGYNIDASQIETNIVVFELPDRSDATPLVNWAYENGVWFTSFMKTKMRVVTHLDLDDEKIARAIEVLSNYLHK